MYKNELYEENIGYTSDPKGLAHKYLNKVLDKIEEYARWAIGPIDRISWQCYNKYNNKLRNVTNP